MKDPMENIVSVGDVMQAAMKELMPRFERMKEQSDRFVIFLDQQKKSCEREYCLEHEDQILDFDEDRTYGRSWNASADGDVFVPVFADCPVCREIKLKVESEGRWVKRGIPSKVLHATFDNFIDIDEDPDQAKAKQKALGKFQRQLKTGHGFIIAIGKFGTGKSHLAAAAMRQAGGGLFVTLADLVGELRQTYSDNEGQDNLVDRYRSAKVLVLDELTTEVKGSDIPQLLYRILGHRHDNDRLTIITSNEAIEVCMEILGGKIRDRIRESYTICNFTWESHRGKK